MRTLCLPVIAAVVVALAAPPARAQVVYGSYSYTPGYTYGGFTGYYPGYSHAPVYSYGGLNSYPGSGLSLRLGFGTRGYPYSGGYRPYSGGGYYGGGYRGGYRGGYSGGGFRGGRLR